MRAKWAAHRISVIVMRRKHPGEITTAKTKDIGTRLATESTRTLYVMPVT